MPTSSVGATSKAEARGQGTGASKSSSGVTLLELLIVMALIALIAGLSYPSVTSGIDSLRLRAASDSIVAFLNTALSRAENRQQVVELIISPKENAIVARSSDRGFEKRLEMPEPIKILAVQPQPENEAEEDRGVRRFLLYPGGSVPRIGIEIANPKGLKRLVSVDPLTGVPQSKLEAAK